MNAVMTDQAGPKKAKRELTPEAFEKLLHWLSEDRETAAKEYEIIRNRLTKYFIRKGCVDSNQLFDETMDRVARNVDEILEHPTPLAFCFGVARNVWLEHRREVKPDPLPPDDLLPVPDPPPDQHEREARCLDVCLAKLPENSRDLITRYYQGQGREKIEARIVLAKEHGGEERLRVKAFRIRSRLRICINDCINRTQ